MNGNIRNIADPWKKAQRHSHHGALKVLVLETLTCIIYIMVGTNVNRGTVSPTGLTSETSKTLGFLWKHHWWSKMNVFLMNGRIFPWQIVQYSQMAIQYSLNSILQCLNDRKGNALVFKHLRNNRQEIIGWWTARMYIWCCLQQVFTYLSGQWKLFKM